MLTVAISGPQYPGSDFTALGSQVAHHPLLEFEKEGSIMLPI